jgi:exopolysaccharide biosynthesis polyprenyl glycosylphosphotransferase
MNRSKELLKYIVADAAAALIVWVLFFIFRRYVNDALIFANVQIWAPNYDFWLTFTIYPIFCFVIYYLSGYYLRIFRKDLLVELVTTLVSSFIISLLIFFVLLLDDIVVSYHYYYYSFCILFVMQFVFTYLFRLSLTHALAQRLKSGQDGFNTLIIGSGINALRTAQELKLLQKKQGNIVKGFLKFDEHPVVDSSLILGHMDRVGDIIREYRISEVFVAIENPDERKIFNITNQLYQYNITIKLLPRVYEILTGRVRMTNMYSSPFIDITELKMPDWEICCKRAFDFGLASLLLLLLSPVYFYLAIRVKRDSPGPVFYLQERIGLHGRTFKIIKFRTMYLNAENGIPKLTSDNDHRITPFGNIMRKYRLDELPQFFNILKGDMSVVGPRPERKFFIDQIIKEAPYYCLLYKVRPGLTSWGPIKVGYTDTLDKMIERLNYDIVYIESMSLLSDIQILYYTLAILLGGKGL